jgi:hypothetical protein
VTVASPSRLGSVTDALTDGTSGISSTLCSDPDKTLVGALTASTPTLDSVLCPQSCPRRHPDSLLCRGRIQTSTDPMSTSSATVSAASEWMTLHHKLIRPDSGESQKPRPPVAPWTDRRDRHGVCAQQPGCSTARA